MSLAWLEMGRYTVPVWSGYVIAAGVFAVNVWWTARQRRQRIRAVLAWLKRDER